MIACKENHGNFVDVEGSLKYKPLKWALTINSEALVNAVRKKLKVTHSKRHKWSNISSLFNIACEM